VGPCCAARVIITQTIKGCDCKLGAGWVAEYS